MTPLVAVLSAAMIAHADGPASRRAEAGFEVRFMTEMIDHHAMALEMGALCLEKALHPELNQLCEEMITAQSAEIEQMQTWLLQWYGVTHEPEMTPGDERQMENLASLDGAEFEIAFMRMLIRHHAIAVVRAADCVHKAAHEELIALCAQMVEVQLNEIRLLHEWLCQWYDICHHGHPHGRARH